jgi:hypothetical protein
MRAPVSARRIVAVTVVLPPYGTRLVPDVVSETGTYVDTAFDRAEDALSRPAAVWARTLNRYDVPGWRPVTVATCEAPETVVVAPPGVAVTVYVDTSEPPLSFGIQYTVADVPDRVA